MPHRQGSSLSDPIVGIYFGIFAATLASGVVLLLILEQLGFADATLKGAMVLIAVALFATIGAAAYTRSTREFLFAGRRVPAVYNGLALAIATPGGAGLAGFAGALFLIGFDALCLGLGLVAGLTVSVMLIAPYLRKLGAPTVSSYLGLRFDSGALRLVSASVAALPLMLLAIAEIKIAIMAAQWLVPLSTAVAASSIVCVLIAMLAPGGMRSLSWSSAAQALVALVAVMLPAAVAAVMETNLPFGQLSHGPLLRAVGRLEAAQNVPIPIAGLLSLDLPGHGLQAIAGRYATVFGSIGPLAFALVVLAVMAGVAGSPSMLSRAVTTPSVYETRKSAGWAVVLAGVLVTTLSSVAVFERDLLLNALSSQPAGVLPVPLQRLVELGLAAADGRGKLGLSSVQLDRDGMLLALPVMMGMPLAVVNLVAAGVLAAALAGAAVSITQLGIVAGEDVVSRAAGWSGSEARRLAVCRVAIAGAAVLAGAGAALTGGDPLALVLLSLAVSGSTLFPVLALSVWWKRSTALGALAGLVAGLVTVLALAALAELTGRGLPALLAPAAAIPVAVLAMLSVSHLTPAPSRHILELVRDLRIPGGETIHDREERQARQRGARSR
ncbi:MAG: sodium:solute symporter [Hyphomicrobiaceae bacterium]